MAPESEEPPPFKVTPIKVEGVPLTLDIVGEGELKGEVQPSTVLRFVERDLHV